jgi:hypothetical protein
MTKMRVKIGYWLTIACIGCGSGGCAVSSQDGQRMRLKSDAYADYVEQVFQHQSEISTELAFVLADEDPDSPRFARLEDAELDVLDACRGLNELASAQRSGTRPGGFAALKQSRQVPECELAADAAATALAE